MSEQSLQERSTYAHLRKRPPEMDESPTERIRRRGVGPTLRALVLHPIFLVGIVCAAVVLPATYVVFTARPYVPAFAFWVMPPIFLLVTILVMLLLDPNWNTERSWHRPSEE